MCNNELTRYSRDGDDFHILWTTIRALDLLSEASDLKLISIEGLPENKDEDTYCIDTAEFYGAVSRQEAKKIIFNQFKYSAKNPNEIYTPSKLNNALVPLLKKFVEYKNKKNISSIEYKFITNAIVPDNAFDINKIIKTYEAKYSTKENKKVTVEKCIVEEFLNKHFKVEDKTTSRDSLSCNLKYCLRNLTGFNDDRLYSHIKSLTHQLTQSDKKNTPTITKETLLKAFGCTEEDLFPCSSNMKKLNNLIKREQENDLIYSILSENNHTLIVHAAGGIGKTTILESISQKLSRENEVVLFDGFAGGLVRTSSDGRYMAKRGLVHITNILAQRNLCGLFIPSPMQHDGYIREFKRKIEQVCNKLAEENKNRKLIIIIDAADNICSAARENGEKCFIHDIIKEEWPENIHFVFSTRSERKELLSIPIGICEFELKGFTLSETSEYLRKIYENISSRDISKFHNLTSGIPRIQSRIIDHYKKLDNIFSKIFAPIKNIDEIIEEQWNSSCKNIVKQGYELDTVLLLNKCLAAFPSPIPIKALSLASQLDENTIKSFIADLDAEDLLLLNNEKIIFNDEPTETFYRKKFLPIKNDYKALHENLKSIGQNNAYVAIILPRIMFNAESFDEIIDLAVKTENLEISNNHLRKQIIFERLKFALKASIAIKQNNKIAQILFILNSEQAENERYYNILNEQYDISPHLVDSNQINDFISRSINYADAGEAYAFKAATLATMNKDNPEALKFLNKSLLWVDNYFHNYNKEDRKENISNEHLTAITWAKLNICGVDNAINFIKGFNHPWDFHIANSIINKCRFDIDMKNELWIHSKSFPLIRLAFLKDDFVEKISTKEDIEEIFSYLNKEDKKYDNFRTYIKHHYHDGAFKTTLIDFLELSFHKGIEREKIKKVFDNFIIISKYMKNFDEPITHIKSLYLYNLCDNKVLDNTIAMPEEVKEEYELNRKKEHSYSPKYDEFKRSYKYIYDWYTLFTDIKYKKKCLELDTQIENLITQSIPHENYRGNEAWIVNSILKIWIDIIYKTGINTKKLKKIYEWIDKSKFNIFNTTLLYLIDKLVLVNTQELHKYIYLLANKIKMNQVPEADALKCSQNFTELARLVYNFQIDEAKCYFDEALKSANKFGGEYYNNMRLMMFFADRACCRSSCNIDIIQKYMRCCEYYFDYNNENFPWDDVMHILAKLYPLGCLSVASQLNDNDTTNFYYTLPSIIYCLLSNKRISNNIAASMTSFHAYWNINKSLKDFFTTDEKQNAKIFNILMAKNELSEQDEDNTKSLIKLSKELNISSERVKEYEDNFFFKNKEEIQNYYSGKKVKTKFPSFKKSKTSADYIENYIKQCKSEMQYCSDLSVITHIASSLDISNLVSFIKNLANIQNLELKAIVKLFIELHIQYRHVEHIQKSIVETVDDIINLQCHKLLTLPRWDLKETINECTKISSFNIINIIKKMIFIIPDMMETISAEFLSDLIQIYIEEFNIDTKDLLVLSLSRTYKNIPESFSSVKFGNDWKTTKDIKTSIACFIYCQLANPKIASRWEAAHCIVHLINLGEHNIINIMVELYNETNMFPYNNQAYPFYDWYAKLWFLIALQRSCVDYPQEMKQYEEFFYKQAVESPHTLIKEFAKKALILINSKYANEVKKINVSQFPKVQKSNMQLYRSSWDFMGTENYFKIPPDFSYFIDEIAEIFGKDSQNIVKSVIAEMDKQNTYKIGIAYDADPRSKSSLYKEMNTYCRKGSLSPVSDHRFYLAFNSLCIVAQKLLSKKPLCKSAYYNSWEHWLKNYTIVRDDGKWISDRRDFVPVCELLHIKNFSNLYNEKNWLYNVSSSDLYNQLFSYENIVLERRSYIHKYDNSESVNVDMVVAPLTYALKKIKEYQNEDFYDVPIPISKHDYITNRNLKATVDYESSEFSGFEKFDILKEEIHWPPHVPSSYLIKKMKLESDKDMRIWYSQNVKIIDVKIWNYKEDSIYANGSITTINKNYLLNFLKKEKKCLIIKSRIGRSIKSNLKTASWEDSEYQKIYILDSDGKLRSLYENDIKI